MLYRTALLIACILTTRTQRDMFREPLTDGAGDVNAERITIGSKTVAPDAHFSDAIDIDGQGFSKHSSKYQFLIYYKN